MARNEEKAQSVLSRWIAQQKGENKKKQKRPYLASLVNNLKEAEKWRAQILREISTNITNIQNDALDEYRIKDINDQINKLIREKYHWECRIKELGGPDYQKTHQVFDNEDIISAPGGYLYFGVAKNLPGVRELLQSSEQETKKNYKELYKSIDAFYYGYRDEEDGILEPLERAAEKKVMEADLEEWKKSQRAKGVDPDMVLEMMKRSKLSEFEYFDDHVAIPTKEEMQQMLLEKKKADLLKNYINN
ncbi:pre-mRNA-splicing factor ISY1 homolog [Schistocerca gregaria]|uniref:pre-mRNA-splicing factor ISY1 homolog n=1 Tax=Schistocerca gregaria TaxID=7010 RepID=UPI00211E191C|nr:pre-mRNA-splicing factor ISY1 homolog [Schistocerca gregaria]